MSERLRILVADDDPDAAHALAELLRLEGHVADTASSGNEALRRLDRCQYRVAFLDASLPGRNSIQSFLDLRVRQAEMRSYLMTGFSVGQLLQEMIRHGGVQILDGPIIPELLLAAIGNAGTDGIILSQSDESDAGDNLRACLAESEYASAHARSVAEARARIEEGRVHVLVLELGSRIIDAAGVYVQLQAEGRARPTIIVTSDEPFPGDAASTGIITKPYDPALLLRQIDRLAA